MKKRKLLLGLFAMSAFGLFACSSGGQNAEEKNTGNQVGSETAYEGESETTEERLDKYKTRDVIWTEEDLYAYIANAYEMGMTGVNFYLYTEDKPIIYFNDNVKLRDEYGIDSPFVISSIGNTEQVSGETVTFVLAEFKDKEEYYVVGNEEEFWNALDTALAGNKREININMSLTEENNFELNPAVDVQEHYKDVLITSYEGVEESFDSRKIAQYSFEIAKMGDRVLALTIDDAKAKIAQWYENGKENGVEFVIPTDGDNSSYKTWFESQYPGNGLTVIFENYISSDVNYSICTIKDLSWANELYENLIAMKCEEVSAYLGSDLFFEQMAEYRGVEIKPGEYSQEYTFTADDGEIFGISIFLGETGYKHVTVFYSPDNQDGAHGTECICYGDLFIEYADGETGWCDGNKRHTTDGRTLTGNKGDVIIIWHV